MEIYRSVMMIVPKCALDPSYNVSFDVHCPPSSLPTLARGKQFALVNNKAQGLFSVAFLKEALPTLRKYCEYFGLRYSHEQGYTVKDRRLYEQWQHCTGAMAVSYTHLSFSMSVRNVSCISATMTLSFSGNRSHMCLSLSSAIGR